MKAHLSSTQGVVKPKTQASSVQGAGSSSSAGSAGAGCDALPQTPQFRAQRLAMCLSALSAQLPVAGVARAAAGRGALHILG